MDEMENTMIGRGRDAIEMIVDAGSSKKTKSALLSSILTMARVQ